MMSNENPLSQTTRYYSNQYEAKNGVSMSNVNKTYGAPRENYIRSGEESKQSVFADNSGAYFQNHKGKKVDEKASAPEDPKPRY